MFCVVKLKNFSFPDFNCISLKFGLGMDLGSLFQSSVSYCGGGGMDTLTTSVFHLPLFSPDFVILFENSSAGR